MVHRISTGHMTSGTAPHMCTGKKLHWDCTLWTHKDTSDTAHSKEPSVSMSLTCGEIDSSHLDRVTDTDGVRAVSDNSPQQIYDCYICALQLNRNDVSMKKPRSWKHNTKRNQSKCCFRDILSES